VRILLINTPYPYSEFPEIPMGLAYIAGVLEKEGSEVQVQDFLVEKYSHEKLERKMVEFSPQIVGVNSVTMNYPIASDILRDCKQFDEGIITVIGGPHVSFTPKETLQESPWIDIIVRGEGEITMSEISLGKELKDIDGIAFRENNEIVITPPRRWIEDLDKLPFPARHLFPISKYRAFGGECPLITGRGCPFNCIFCVGHKMVGKRGRFRNPKFVVDEMEEIQGLGFSQINLVDDLFTLSRQHVYAVCDEIISRRLKFNWSAFSRVDTVNRELLTRMKEAGCFFILYGVESGNQQILNTTRKRITLQKVREAINLSREVGIGAFASFIIGLPGETRETLAQTVNFAKELNTSYGFHLLNPFPGTELREKAREYGIRILTNDWLKYNCNEAITETEEATAQMLTEVDTEYKQAVECYYKHQEYLEQEGKLNETGLEEIKKRRQLEIVGSLIQQDIIEGLDRVRAGKDSIKELAEEVSKIISYPPHHIQQVIGELVGEGILKCEKDKGGAKWRWATSPRPSLVHK
jgi:radical SAM superfamily enzyme YgiQ (UPF0313 family)